MGDDEEQQRWAFGINVLGELNLWQHDEMPPAGNLLVVDMLEKDGIWTVAAADLQRVRELIGTPPEKLFRAGDGLSGPDAVAELEDLEQRISSMIRRRIEEITGDADVDDEPSTYRP